MVDNNHYEANMNHYAFPTAFQKVYEAIDFIKRIWYKIGIKLYELLGERYEIHRFSCSHWGCQTC